jgi:hypothetical protein
MGAIAASIADITESRGRSEFFARHLVEIGIGELV